MLSNETCHDVGNRSAGDVVEVTVQGSSANIKLIDEANYGKYRSEMELDFQGDQAGKLPVYLIVPQPGHWYVTVDLGRYLGNVRSGIRNIPS
jgi:hypothetical protein